MSIVATGRFITACRGVPTLCLYLALTCVASGAQPGESIVLDPTTGNYVISYCAPDVQPSSAAPCVLEQITWVPATKIYPRLRSYFQIQGSSISYGYWLKNEPRSAQSIVSFSIDPISGVASPIPSTALNDPSIAESAVVAAIDAWTQTLRMPPEWNGLVVAHPESPGLRATWLYSNVATETDGLTRGQTQNGFGIISNDLPGIVTAEVAGNSGEGPSFNDDGPTGDIAQQFQQLQLNNFVGRFAAVPAIQIPSPFNRAELLRRIEAQVGTWVALKILDPALYTQIDEFLQAAISAADTRDRSSCAAHLDKVHRLLHEIDATFDESDDGPKDKDKTESPLITRLAAHVLIFDLIYAIRQP
jgi:hypothetical protein